RPRPACAAPGLAPAGRGRVRRFPARGTARPPWNRFLNQHGDAVFPLLPWAGYVYLGAAIGSATAEKGPRGAAVWLAALAAAGIVVWSLTPWFAALYPPHEFWVMNPATGSPRGTTVCLADPV